MGKLLAFKRRTVDYEDIEAMLRDFYAEEREMRECEWLEEATRRAEEIPRMARRPRPLEDEKASGPPFPRGCG